MPLWYCDYLYWIYFWGKGLFVSCVWGGWLDQELQIQMPTATSWVGQMSEEGQLYKIESGDRDWW